MNRSRRARMFTAGAFALMASGIACVDLFHETNFETLCARDPKDVACGGDAAIDAPVADVAPKADVVDAAAPHPDFCAWSSTEARMQAQRACAWLGACEGPLGESVFGSCVVRAQLAFDCGANPSLRPGGAADRFWGCLATVRSCADVDGCVFPGGVQSCTSVPAGSSTACGTSANTAVRLKCSGPAGRAVGIEPCVISGKTCSSENPSTSTCSGALGFDTCTANGCAGTSAVECGTAGTRTLDRGLNCASYGAGACVLSDGGPICTPGTLGTSSCSAEATPACDGMIVKSCLGGKEIRVDCTRLGLGCNVSPPVAPYDPTAACKGSGCAEVDSCAGTTLRSCGRGVRFEVDCASVGLGACSVDTNGIGRCAPP